MGVIEMLKGRLDPNITKGWKDMNMLWLKAKTAKRGGGGGEGGETHSEGSGGGGLGSISAKEAQS